APAQTVEVYAHRAEVLVHEATFCEDERARARETGHSTARQAAELARGAGVQLLALTHLSTRYFAREVREEARAAFPNTVVPHDRPHRARDRGEELRPARGAGRHPPPRRPSRPAPAPAGVRPAGPRRPARRHRHRLLPRRPFAARGRPGRARLEPELPARGLH